MLQTIFFILLQALILAAGKGQRLKPLTDQYPKPLVRIGEYTLIEYHILRLAECGVKEIIINVSYKSEQIIDYLKNGQQYGVTISYSIEKPEPLETGGGIKKALAYIDADPFIVVNGDVLSDFDFSQLHLEDQYLANLVLIDNPRHNQQGDFVLSADSTLAHIASKDTPTYTFAGIGLYRQSLFADFPQGTYPLVSVLQRPIHEAKIYAEKFSGQWFDIGTLQRLKQARENFVFDNKNKT